MITREIREIVSQAAIEGSLWENVEEMIRKLPGVDDSDVEHLKKVYERSIPNTHIPQEEQEQTTPANDTNLDRVLEILSSLEETVTSVVNDQTNISMAVEGLQHTTENLSDKINSTDRLVKIDPESVKRAPFWIRSWIAKNSV